MKGNFQSVMIVVGTGVAMAAGAWLFQRWIHPLLPSQIR